MQALHHLDTPRLRIRRFRREDESSFVELMTDPEVTRFMSFPAELNTKVASCDPLRRTIHVWSCPDLTVDRLLFDLLWTGWVVLGATLEERDLVARLGREYKYYQQRVPMLVPPAFPPRALQTTPFTH